MERALGRLTLRSPTSDFTFQANPSGKHVVRFKPAQEAIGKDPEAFSISWEVTGYEHIKIEPYEVLGVQYVNTYITRGGGSGTRVWRASPPEFLEQGEAVINYGDGPRMAYFDGYPLGLGYISITEQVNDGEPVSTIMSVRVHGHMLRWQPPMEFVNFRRTSEEALLIGPAIEIGSWEGGGRLGKDDIYTLDELLNGVSVDKSFSNGNDEHHVSYTFRITNITPYMRTPPVEERIDDWPPNFSPWARERWDPTLVRGNKWEDWYA